MKKIRQESLIVKVSTEGTEKDDDGNTIDLTDEEKAQKKRPGTAGS